MKFNHFDRLVDELTTRQSALTKETEAHLDRALSLMDAIDSMFAPVGKQTTSARDDVLSATKPDRRQPDQGNDVDVLPDANNTTNNAKCPLLVASKQSDLHKAAFCQFVEIIDDKYHVKPFHPRDLAQVTHELSVLIAESDPHYAHDYFGGE